MRSDMKAERDGDDVGLTLSATEARYLLRVARETVLGIDLEHSQAPQRATKSWDRKLSRPVVFSGMWPANSKPPSAPSAAFRFEKIADGKA